MSYDQAQSPRLGQRTPVESTYVQIYDVDPATETADLIEAAWPGMLVFRKDLEILQIFDGETGAWKDVAGGVAGQLTYVGTEPPTGGTYTVGDTWYDSDAGMKAYVWDGDSWEESAGGIQTYYADGWGVQEPPDPEFPDIPPPPPPWVPLVGSFNVGDIWYQTDAGNHPYRWSGTEWIDISDGDIALNTDAVATHTGEISSLEIAVAEATFIARSANNTADTADGRVSMSDYMPGPDDSTYEQVMTNPITGESYTATVPRVNGSIWFTRTRPRLNLCTNPSVETNLDGWSGGGLASPTPFVRMAHTYVPAGQWVIHVYANASTTEDHWMSWGESSRVPCEEGQTWTASVYAELVEGLGLGVYLTIRWYDDTGTFIEAATGPALDLSVDAFTPVVIGTQSEPRMWVTGTAPAGAASFDVREISPASNANDQWHTGALLIEQEDDLGRYFDGDSYDCSWEGTAHESTTRMEGDKIIEVWELRDSAWIRKFLTSSTIYSLDAAKLTGSLHGSIITPNSIATEKQGAVSITASEDLVAGDFVHVWNSAGSFRVRKASAASGAVYEAHGFVLDTVSSGASVRVYHVGYNEKLGNMAPGAQFLSAVPGQVAGRPPTTVGTLVQRIGYAPSSNTLNFSPSQAIRIT